MFFNGLWIYGSLLLLIVGMAARQPALTVLATLVLLTAGLSWLWNRYSLHAVTYRRRLSATRLFRGETLVVEFELVNKKLLPLAWIEAQDDLPDRVVALDRRVAPGDSPGRIVLPYVTSLRPYERVTWRATLRCPHRGYFTVGPARLASGDIFGFFSREERVATQEAILVYPRVVPLLDLGIPPRQAFGETRAPRALLVDPLRPVGIRDYRPEDSQRDIHWKATARMQQLQVRVFEPTTVTQLALFLDLDSDEQFWRAIETDRLEAAISVAASLAAFAVDQRYAVGVYSNRFVGGAGRPLRVAPGGGPAQLTKVLESLAKLSPFGAIEFAKHLRQETRNFPWGSTIVVIAATMPPALAATLETLRAEGQRVVLVAIDALVAPPIRGLTVHRLPEALIAALGAENEVRVSNSWWRLPDEAAAEVAGGAVAGGGAGD